MDGRRWRLRALVAAACATAAGVAALGGSAGTLWTGDWETGGLTQWDVAQRTHAGDIAVVTSPLRQGRYAAHFTVHPGDLPVGGGERAEVLKSTGEAAGQESWWTWSAYFPSSFRSNPNSSWNVFTQWHHSGSTGVQPVSFEVENDSGREYLRFRAWGGSVDNPTRVAWRLAPLQRNHWYDIAFHVRWAADSSGLVEVWVDGQPAVPLTRTPTLYAGQSVHLKQGFYRNGSSLTTDLYQDGVRRGDSASAIGAPSGTGAFGYATVGSGLDAGGAGYLDVSGPYTTSRTATVTSLSAFVLSTSVDSRLRAVLYADAGGRPGAVVATSQETIVAANIASQWLTFPLASPVSVPAGKYWLGYWYGDGNSRHYRQPSTTGTRWYAKAPYASTGNAPSTFPAPTASGGMYTMLALYR